MSTPTSVPNASSTSMSTAALPSRPKLSSQPATIEEYIEWLTELAQFKGMIGMSTEMLSREKFSALFSVGESIGMPLTDDASELNMALGDAIKDSARENYLVKVLKENAALMPRAKVEINKRLLAAGANLDFVNRSSKAVSPLMRVAKLENLKNPPPASKPKFVLWLETFGYNVLSSRGTEKIYLNKDASFLDFLAQMKKHSAYTANVTLGIEGGLDREQGFWVYQLLNTHRQIRQGTPNVVLKDGEVYLKMLKEMSKQSTPSVVLRHVGTTVWLCSRISLVLTLVIQERIMQWEEETRAEMKAFDEEYPDNLDDNEPLDEDGKPYFDAEINWEVVRAKFLKDGFPWEKLAGNDGTTKSDANLKE
ncbi:MAG: hypothetical protein M1812_001208 [Candelaria pacifica]|nr:MAG: hypothetical protein M1812_001208 [Candelaria pacifica]